MIEIFRKWLYSYPDHDNWFENNIRKTFQAIFPCKHVWKYNRGKFRRDCQKCWQKERLKYYRCGNVRTEWIVRKEWEKLQ